MFLLIDIRRITLNLWQISTIQNVSQLIQRAISISFTCLGRLLSGSVFQGPGENGIDKVFLHFRSMKLVVIHQGLDSGGHAVTGLVCVLQHVQVADDLLPPFQTGDETSCCVIVHIPISISVSIANWIWRWKLVHSGRPFLRVSLIGNSRNFSSDLGGFFLLRSRNSRTHQPAKRPEKVTRWCIKSQKFHEQPIWRISSKGYFSPQRRIVLIGYQLWLHTVCI